MLVVGQNGCSSSREEHSASVQTKKAEYVKKWDEKPEKPMLRATDAR